MSVETKMKMSERFDLIEKSEYESDIVTAYKNERGLQKFIDIVDSVVADFTHDLSTDKGRKKTASLARRIASFKVKLDSIGKKINQKPLDQIAFVNRERDRMKKELDRIKILARKPLVDWELKEQERTLKHQDTLMRINNLSILNGNPGLDGLNRRLNEIESIDVTRMEEFEEAGRDAVQSCTKIIQYAIESEKSRLALEERHAAEKTELERKNRELEEKINAAGIKEDTCQDSEPDDKWSQSFIDRALGAEGKRKQGKVHKEQIEMLCVAGLLESTDISTDVAEQVVKAVINNKIPWIKIDYEVPLV